MNDLIPGVKLSGEVDFHGQDLYGSSVDPTWLRKQIGMVFQKANPFPMSIYDNVAYGPRTHGIRNRGSWTRSWRTLCVPPLSGTR